VPPAAATISLSASRAPAGRVPLASPCSRTAHSVTADTAPRTSASPSLRCHSQTRPCPSSARPYPAAGSRPGTSTQAPSPERSLLSGPRPR
jgi:hypothetical protein